MATRHASQLAPFTENWIGGNLRGLQALAESLSACAPEMEGALAPLERAVSQLVSPDAWQGTAAAAFARAWARDEITVTALAIFVGDAAAIIDQLAVTLGGIENALEEAAYQARKTGIPVGSDGTIEPAPLTGAQQQTAAAYEQFRQRCLADAQDARTQAATALNQLCAQILSPRHDLNDGELATISDYLRGLLALPTSYRKYVDTKLSDVKAGAAKVRLAAINEARGADGRFGPWTDYGRQQFADARARLASVEDQALTAEKFENLPSRILGFGVADLAKGGAEWDGVARFLGDIPLASGALAGVSTGLTIADDRARGESWGLSVSDGLTSNAASLIGGEGAGALGAAGGEAFAAGILGASATVAGVLGTASGFAVGGVVAVGVGDFVHNAFQENWAADIHDHGVIGGIGHGTADTFDHTRHDIAHLASGIWHAIF